MRTNVKIESAQKATENFVSIADFKMRGWQKHRKKTAAAKSGCRENALVGAEFKTAKRTFYAVTRQRINLRLRAACPI